MAKLKVAALISGRGTNLQALIDACASPDFPAEIAAVICNEPEARGIRRSRAAGIPVAIVNHRAFESREAFDTALTEAIRASGAEFVCLAGFMRVVTQDFVRTWYNRLINIHPSLLPAFRGLNTHARALDAGVRFAGCTVHFVRAEMDAGPIIAQAAVAVLDGDTPETLARRVLEAEHRIYPLALRLIAEGRVRVADEVVRISGAAAPEGLLINPLDD
ncbi:MAG: phosphoribosylglycinamide formyltransferase [Alphaproteobacteria bacterium]